MKILIILFWLALFVEQFAIFNVGSYSVTTADIICIIMIVKFLIDIFWYGKKLIIPKNYLLLIFSFLFFIPFLSWIPLLVRGNAGEIMQTFKSTAHYQFTLFFVFIFNTRRMDLKEWDIGIKIFVLISIVVNVYAIYQLPARAFDWPMAYIELTASNFNVRGTIDNEDVGQIVLKFENFYRATSFFSEPSALAGFNVSVFVFFIPQLFQKRGKLFHSKALNVLIISLLLTGLLLAFSLTGLLTLFGLISAIVLFERREIIPKLILYTVLGMVFVSIVNLVVENYTNVSVLDLFSQRVSSISQGAKDSKGGITGESFYTRSNNFEIGYNTFLKNPVFGYGFGNYSRTNDTFVFSDSGLMSLLSETGIFGGLLFLSLHLLIIYYGFIFVKHKNLFTNPKLIRLSGCILYLMIEQTLVNVFTANQLVSYSMWLFFLLSMMVINEYKIGLNQYYEMTLIKAPLRNKFLAAKN